ncbi:MAG: MgtC/SapB family protein [Phaeodactylibacter sp.]|uniref:MgtC/SapB family protein n=1 Tax=Phaeodactylibacter sp. TaxID=1940289 RepID=UPI0032ECC7A0
METLEIDINLLQQFQSLLIVLGIGLLLGLEREQAYHLKEGKVLFAGIRTFPIVAILGYLAVFLGEVFSGWAFFGVLLGVFSIIGIAFLRAQSSIGGTTTEFSLMLVFLLGGMVKLGYNQLSVAIAIGVTVLLAFKFRLHKLAGALSQAELMSILQFLLVTALLLPLLPDQDIGPYGFFNAYKTGLILSIFLALNFVGYFLARFFQDRSTMLTGILGGLASSTATAWYFSRRVGKGKGNGSQEAAAVVLASSIMFPRLLVWPALLNWELFKALALPIMVLGLLGALVSWYLFRSAPHDELSASPEPGNPLNFREALVFTLIYTGIQLGVGYASEQLGETGVYWAAAISGFADVDAITVSMSEYGYASRRLEVAAVATVLAAFSNTMVKYGFCLAFGNRTMRRKSTLGFAVILLAAMGYAGWMM